MISSLALPAFVDAGTVVIVYPLIDWVLEVASAV
jgi:hypothetical protein